ncbi:MAG: TonB-dependent SusC/RagA subfamily outer membrane receptor [Maribacter sp.]|jgi:TonB-dependent SusC/RagA subfamily outer membrane receptor
MEQTIRQGIGSETLIKNSTLWAIIFILFQAPFSFSQHTTTKPISNLPNEKIYLHLDKNYYTAGEDIWFKAYVLDANTHEPSILSGILYVELIDAERTILNKRIVKTANGSAAGDFQLSSKLPSGPYTIRAYTNYMRNFGISNFFTKEIFINTSKAAAVTNILEPEENISSLDVQFFPEGGYLVNGFLNPVGFKAIDDQGNSIAITGKLVDDTGKRIKEFSSTHLGMGLLYFIPKPGRTYKAIVSYRNQEKNFSLPKALNSGVLMTVSNQPKHYKIELRGTTDLKMKDFRLIGKQLRGTVFNLIVNANKQEHTTIVKIAKDILEEGILELTLLNQEKKPIAERLLFHEVSSNSPLSKITTSKTSYGQRELAAMEVEIEVAHSKEITADMSLSITNVVVNPAAVHTTNIKTHLLLSSVLKGKIDQPGYYFYSRAIDRQKNLDILMRTQGWRQYALDEQLVKEDKYFLPETGITLSGKVVNALRTAEQLTGSVSLTANSATEMIQDRAKTAMDGSFSFNNLDFTDTTTVLLSANVYYPKKIRNPTLNYKIILDSIPSPPVFGARNVAGAAAISASSSASKTMERFTTGYEKAQQTTLSFLYTDKTIQLDEVFIAVKKKPKAMDKFQRKRRGMPYKEPSQTLDYNELDVPMDEPLLSLQGRVPGLSVRDNGIFLRGASSLTGDNSALILVDGIPFAGANLLLTSEIDFIDILKGPRAAIYGSRAANGVIAIFTKNGTESSAENKERGGSLNIEHPGYTSTRKFYEPKYGSNPPKSKEIDNRTTLHWQPYIQLNDEGKTSISFYSGDVLGDYQVTLEGITTEGVPVKSTTTFSVE